MNNAETVFKVKGGGRNRARCARKAAKRAERVQEAVSRPPGNPRRVALKRALSGVWTPETASVALNKFEATGLSQKEFGRRFGISPRKLGDWKRKLQASG